MEDVIKDKDNNIKGGKSRSRVRFKCGSQGGNLVV